MPLVSICIPTFNSEQYITDALNSARNQTFEDIEIIVIDNCSNDSTVEICKAVSKSDPRIRVYQNESNIGVCGNYNKCIELAQGEYVKLLPSDDLIEPVCVERMVQAFDKYPDVNIVGCLTQVVDAAGNWIRAIVPSTAPGIIPGRKIMKRMLMHVDNFVGPPTSVLMRRSSYEGGFNCSLFQLLDMDMWLRALRHGNYYYIDEPYASLRLHINTCTSTMSKTLLFLADIILLKELYASFMEEEGVDKQEWHQIVDEHIFLHCHHQLKAAEINIDELRKYVSKLNSIVGSCSMERLVEALAELNFYAFSLVCGSDHRDELCGLKYELKWNKDEVERLSKEINSMSKTLAWRTFQPLRELKSKLFIPSFSTKKVKKQLCGY